MAEKNQTLPKKPNIFVRMGRRIGKFFRDYHSEMKKVVWTSKDELRKSTKIVLVTVAAIGVAAHEVGHAIQHHNKNWS